MYTGWKISGEQEKYSNSIVNLGKKAERQKEEILEQTFAEENGEEGDDEM